MCQKPLVDVIVRNSAVADATFAAVLCGRFCSRGVGYSCGCCRPQIDTACYSTKFFCVLQGVA
ncbi:MAG TPA: hypothetical protein DHU79_05360 [Clostridiales bacterium]|nr:hypothetical protein [Clostridiales bacterium]